MHSLDKVAAMLRSRFHKFVGDLGLLTEVSHPHRHLAITLVCRSSRLHIVVNVKELDFQGVRATSVLCLLGFGLGIGSLLIYRLCSRLFAHTNVPPVLPGSVTTGRKRRRSSSLSSLEDGETTQTAPQTPSDSGISTSSMVTMGNNPSGEVLSPDDPVHYSPKDGVRFRGRFQHGEDDPVANGGRNQGYGVDSDLRKQLSINIPERGPRHMTMSSTGSEDPGMMDSFRSTRHTSEDQISLMPNFSPDSLYEKNFKYRDVDNRISSHSEISEVFSEDYSLNSENTTDKNRTSIVGNKGEQIADSNRNTLCSEDVDIDVHDRCSEEYSSDTQHGNVTRDQSNDILDNSISEKEEDGDQSAFENENDYHLDVKPQDSSPADSPRHSTPRFNMKNIDAKIRPKLERILSNESSPLRSSSNSQHSLLSDLSLPDDFSFASQSLDLSDASGIATPDSELFGTQQVGLETEEGMNHLQDEIHNIVEEIEEMEKYVNRLQGRRGSALELEETAKSTELKHALKVLKRHKSRDFTGPRSQSVSDAEASVDADSQTEWRKSYNHSGEYMWDYASEADEDAVAREPWPLEGRTHPPSLREISHSRTQGESASFDFSVDSTSSVNDSTSLKQDTLQERSKSISKQDEAPVAVGERQNLLEYAEKEWKGSTPRALKMRQGYEKLEKCTGCGHLRRIRGDNFCGPRAVVFQALSSGLPILTRWGTWQQIQQRLSHLKDHAYLQDWEFASAGPGKDQDLFDQALSAVQVLHEQVEAMSCISSELREQHVAAALNADRDLDLLLMDAVKVLMMAAAIELHEENTSGKEVPTFAWLMYARETSMTPSDFYKNHLRLLGNQAGLEQVEMFLLGYTLEVSIDVARLSCFDQEDFITSFCYDNAKKLPTVLLVAEDDRHYNVLVQ